MHISSIIICRAQTRPATNATRTLFLRHPFDLVSAPGGPHRKWMAWMYDRSSSVRRAHNKLLAHISHKMNAACPGEFGGTARILKAHLPQPRTKGYSPPAWTSLRSTSHKGRSATEKAGMRAFKKKHLRSTRAHHGSDMVRQTWCRHETKHGIRRLILTNWLIT
jgi:hypothetical protein